jgi:hypothetical protein
MAPTGEGKGQVRRFLKIKAMGYVLVLPPDTMFVDSWKKSLICLAM